MENITVAEFKILLARRIRQLRKNNALSQSELALKIGFKDKQVVNTYEIKGANPTAYNMILIARALNVTIEELLNFEKLEKNE